MSMYGLAGKERFRGGVMNGPLISGVKGRSSVLMRSDRNCLIWLDFSSPDDLEVEA